MSDFGLTHAKPNGRSGVKRHDVKQNCLCPHRRGGGGVLQQLKVDTFKFLKTETVKEKSEPVTIYGFRCSN
jgi:hypothetical protein